MRASKVFLSILFMGIAFLTSAQKLHIKSIYILSANDSYTLTGKDGYYTNGLELGMHWTSQKNTTIHTLNLGQDMYNAHNGSYDFIYELDRPITAYLYLAYGQTHFTKFDRSVLQWNVNLSTIGPNALGKPVQKFIHHTLGMYKPEEWQFQLRNALGVDLNALYAYQLTTEKSPIHLYSIAKAALGTNYVFANMGASLQLGKVLQASVSQYWNGSINRTTKIEKESFFYFYPQLQINGYNSTVQGRWIDSKPEIYTAPLAYLQSITEIGYMYSSSSFTFKIAYTYETKQAKSQYSNQIFGKIGLEKNL